MSQKFCISCSSQREELKKHNNIDQSLKKFTKDKKKSSKKKEKCHLLTHLELSYINLFSI